MSSIISIPKSSSTSSSSSSSSFSSWAIYGRALMQTPSRLRRRAWAPAVEARARPPDGTACMRRELHWLDAVTLGVGGMLGAGVFITTGSVARDAGPSVVLSYLIAGFSALLSSLCYAEFAIQVPMAGGAFSYLRATFGEFAGFLTGANLLMEYVLSNAAVSRSFTSYFSSVFGFLDQNAWRLRVAGFKEGYNTLDFPAVVLLALLTVFICYSTKSSSILNIVLTVFHILLMLFIVVACFINGDLSNFTGPTGGFAPQGAREIFKGAATVYMSYIGYDAVSTLAEEVKIPDTVMPIGVSGSVVIVTLLYCLMSTSLCVMIPYYEIVPEAAFSKAFNNIKGWKWATNVVGIGSTLGIVTSLLVAMLGQARYMCVIGRANIIPRWFAKVNSETGTPINAAVFLGCCTSIVAFLTDLDILLNMLSIGTIFVFYMVANALIYRRYVILAGVEAWHTLLFLVLLSSSALGFAISWRLQMWWGLVTCSVFAALSAIFWVRRVSTFEEDNNNNNNTKAEKWCLPFMPWVACSSIFLNVFLLNSLDVKSFKRFGIWTAACILFYVFYSVHATHDDDEEELKTRKANPEDP